MIERNGKGFTLVEMLVCTGIAVFVIAASWSIYVIGVSWSTKMIPEMEAQRLARITMRTIVDGFRDAGAGTDTISGQSCSRRNGIAWATALPTVTSDSTKITYNLEDLNNQTFYTLKDESPMKLYHNSAAVPGTTGITDLTFEVISLNEIKVTVKVDKYINVGAQDPHHISVESSEIVYIRNV